MGGTFDPIHNGHLRAAEEVREALYLDRVIFIPAGQPVLKLDKKLSSAQDRLNMCLLATAGNPHFSVSDLEIQRAGLTYTVDTILELRGLYPNAQLYFIVGTDAAETFHKWRDADKILENCCLVVVSRPGENKGEHSRNYQYLDICQMDISSTKIREAVAKGCSISYLLPEAAAQYISKHELYRDEISRFTAILAAELSRPRYQHSMSVMEEAVALGKHHGADADTLKKLEIAGLLHDCAKNWSEEMPYSQVAEICARGGYVLDGFFAKTPALAHGYMGAVLAQEKYGITDPEIISAIANHTFADQNMSFIDKIIYLSDFIEPTRAPSEDREAARQLAYKDIDKALLFVLELTIRRNLERGRNVYQKSIQAKEFLEEQNGKR